MRDLVTTYARQVVKGKVPCVALHRAACARHLRDLDERRARGLVWRPALGQGVGEFFGHLKHFKGEWAGRPPTLAPWQPFIVGSRYGWQRDGVRRFRTAFIELPRGNGKSTLAGGLGLWMAFLDGEPVAACPEGPWQKAVRLAARYRVPILLVLAYVLARAALLKIVPALQPGTKQHRHIFGAYSWKTDRISWRCADWKNSQTFLEFVEYLLVECYQLDVLFWL